MIQNKPNSYGKKPLSKIKWFFILVVVKYVVKGEGGMKLEINVNKDEENERIVIYTKQISHEIQHMVEQIEKLLGNEKLFGFKDEEIYPLDIEKIVRFYTENKSIFAECMEEKYKVEKRLYELEEMLPGNFLRISQSEIINIRYIKKLKLEFNGFIKIHFKNDVTTYSSRRYVKKIKEALQL